MSNHVLIVEPDKLIAENYAHELSSHGYSVAWSKTAQSAIFQADETRPGAIILELQIARHNGIEFLYEFVSYPEWQDIPVVILTSLSVEKVKRFKILREQLNVMEILSKSHTTLSELVAVIDTVVLPR